MKGIEAMTVPMTVAAVRITFSQKSFLPSLSLESELDDIEVFRRSMEFSRPLTWFCNSSKAETKIADFCCSIRKSECGRSPKCSSNSFLDFPRICIPSSISHSCQFGKGGLLLR